MGRWIVVVSLLVSVSPACTRHDVDVEPPTSGRPLAPTEQRELQQVAEATFREVRGLLAGLPPRLTLIVRWSKDVMPETGESAAAGFPGNVGLSLDPDVRSLDNPDVAPAHALSRAPPSRAREPGAVSDPRRRCRAGRAGDGLRARPREGRSPLGTGAARDRGLDARDPSAARNGRPRSVDASAPRRKALGWNARRNVPGGPSLSSLREVGGGAGLCSSVRDRRARRHPLACKSRPFSHGP